MRARFCSHPANGVLIFSCGWFPIWKVPKAPGDSNQTTPSYKQKVEAESTRTTQRLDANYFGLMIPTFICLPVLFASHNHKFTNHSASSLNILRLL